MSEAAISDPESFLRLYLLGQFRAKRGGQEIPDEAWKRRKTRALVKALAVEPTHRLHREQLQEALWPELDPAAGYGSLRKALHHARHLLQPDLVRGDASIYLRLAGEMLVLNIDEAWIDADHFERTAHQALASGNTAELESAASLYTGELLPEDLYEEWSVERRAALTELSTQVLLRLAEVYERNGRISDASDRLQQTLSRDPAREEVHRRLMHLYATGGSRHQALRQYQSLRRVLAEEYDAEPDEVTESLHAEIRAGRIAPAPALVRPRGSPVPHPILRGVPPTPLVGRERSFEILLAGLLSPKDAQEKPPALMLVSGEAGVGKTRLMLELARAALRQDMLVLWGASYETEGALPYGPFIEALNTALSSWPLEKRELIAEEQPELARLLPVLGPARPLDSLDPRSEQPRLFAAVARLLTQLAAEQPLLLVLDDLHTMDTVSLQLLHHLIRLASGQRWFITGTYRDESMTPGSELQTMLAALHRSGLARHMDLLRLARADCDRMVSSMIGEAPIDNAALHHIYALSMGNPLFAGELVQAMQTSGELASESGRWILRGGRRASQSQSVPQQIRALVEARVHALGDGAQQALALAATAGMEVSFTVLAAAAARAFPDSLPENALLDALDAALAARILEERGDAYAFRHPLFREALYARLSGNRRARLHLSLAQAIDLEQPSDVERLAHHYMLGGDRVKAAIHLRHAGELAEDLCAYAAAETHYRNLLSLLVGNGDVDEAFALACLGTVVYLAGRPDEALTYLQQASTLYSSSTDLEGLARAGLVLSQARYTQGARSESLAGLRAVINIAKRQGVRRETLARLYFELGTLLFYSGEYDESVQLAERGSQLALDAGDLRTYAWAQSRLGVGLQVIGRVAESQTVLERCIPMLDPVRDSRFLALALNNLCVVHEFYGNTAEVLANCRHAVQVADRSSEPWVMAAMQALLGGVLLEIGEWDEARSCLECSRTILGTVDLPATDLVRLCYGARLEYLEGNWETACGHYGEVAVGASQLGDIQFQRLAQTALAEIDVREGRPQEAVRRLEGLLDRPGMEEPVVVHVLCLLARAYALLGDADRAVEMSSRALVRCESRGYRGLLAPALVHSGILCAQQQRWQEADEAFSRGATLAHALCNPFVEGRCLAEWSDSLFIQGKVAASREKRAAARTIFERLGASKELELLQSNIPSA